MNMPDVVAAIRPWDGTEADLDRYLNGRAAADQRLMEGDLVTGLGWSVAACLASEVMSPWRSATAGRWHYRALLRGEAS